MNKSKRIPLLILCSIGVLAVFTRLFLGFFVIQPLGVLPDGVTLLYWRAGLNLPFIASADGILEKSGAGISIFGRAAVLGTMAETIKPREIARLGYSETLFNWSISNGNIHN